MRRRGAPAGFPSEKKKEIPQKKLFMKMNPKRKILWSPLVAAAVVALSGCSFSLFSTGAGSTPTRHFVLSSEAPASENLPAVTFSRVTIPSYLDVPQIVQRDGNEISRSEANRWGEPLARGAARELALRCSAAMAEKGAAGTLPAQRVTVSLDRFDGTLDGNVEISAVYAALPKTAAAHAVPAAKNRLFHASVPVAGPNDYAAYVRALDDALDLLAEDIAATLAGAPAQDAAPAAAK